jgi:hypothetical protein
VFQTPIRRDERGDAVQDDLCFEPVVIQPANRPRGALPKLALDPFCPHGRWRVDVCADRDPFVLGGHRGAGELVDA